MIYMLVLREIGFLRRGLSQMTSLFY